MIERYAFAHIGDKLNICHVCQEICTTVYLKTSVFENEETKDIHMDICNNCAQAICKGMETIKTLNNWQEY